MRKFDTDKRYLALGLAGALVIALAAVVGALIWANQASAARAVVLIHVQKDGSDYRGNPDCPGGGQMRDLLGNAVTDISKSVRAIDDCNNLIGTQHVIRTDGFDLTMVADASPWVIVSGPGVILSGNPAKLCGDTTEATSLPNWNTDNNNQYCVVISSNNPGETVMRFGYTFTPPAPTETPTTTVTPSPTPTPPVAGHQFTDPVVKEWNKLDHTEIWQLACTDSASACTLSDLVGEGDLTGETLVETSEVPIVFDTSSDRLRGLKRLREIVWGWHEDPDAPGGIIKVPVEGARVTAMIDNNEDGVADTFNTGTCAFFTTFNTIGIPPDRGTLLTGITRTQLEGTKIVTHALFDDPTVPGADLLLNDIYVDTTCKEVTTIRIKVEYPVGIFSEPGVIWEKTKINWQEQEIGKQPQIRWAGEKIVLAKRWALPIDFIYPNPLPGGAETGAQCDNALDDDTDGFVNDGCPAVGTAESGTQCLNAIDDLEDTTPDGVVNDGCPTVAGALSPVCPHAGKIVQYNDEDGPGGLTSGLPDLGGPLSNEPDRVTTIVDAQCISRAMFESQEQGQVDVKAVLLDFPSVDGQAVLAAHQAVLNACIATYNASTKAAADKTALNTCLAAEDAVWMQTLRSLIGLGGFLTSEEKQDAFLVWYLKIYQVKLENVLLADGAGRKDHNAGTWGGEDPVTGEVATAETLNVSQDALQKITVKGFFYGGDPSGRPDICLDMDGDGDGDDATTEDVPGEPYAGDTSHTGCKDPDDELLAGGYWVLPDDMPKLGGKFWYVDKSNWDVMSEDSPTNTGVIGYKSTLDSHGSTVDNSTKRLWVPAFNTTAGFNTTRKTVDPDGKLTAADAIMPPLKLTAMINDPKDAGFLKQALKSGDLGISSLYQFVMIPADPEIPQLGGSGGGTYGYELNSWARGPYEFFKIFLSALHLATDCNDVYSDSTLADGKLCNAMIGNQLGQDAQDENHARVIQFYSDNRGLGFFFANGDFNLSFDDCPKDELTGTPVCSPDDVVGTSKIQVQGAYPYFRKFAGVDSNLVTKTWTWGGFKSVTAVSVDLNHTAVIAHVKDRDGFCKFSVDIKSDGDIDVVFSPSEHPVQGEEIEFILNNKGVASIIGVSPNALYDAAHTPLGEATVTGSEDGVILNLNDAVALAEDVRVLDGMVANGMSASGFGARGAIDDDECQAWIVVQHPAQVQPDVSVLFNDPEGQVTRHYPPKGRTVRLVNGWNDSCFTDRAMPIESALAAIIDNVLAVYRYDPTDTADPWKGWFPDRPDVSQITDLSPYDQLFILMDASVDWPMDITNPPASLDLLKDWNSVCYAGASKSPDDATASIAGDFQIIYTLATDQGWRRFVPGREDLNTIGATLDQFTSILILVTAEDGVTWVFDP